MWYDSNNEIYPQDVKIIKLTKNTKIALKNKDIESLDDLKQQMRETLSENNEKQYFISVSSTSGKNDEAFTLRDFSRMEKETCIIFVPWQSKINDRNEFRLCVVDRKFSCCSPQKL